MILWHIYLKNGFIFYQKKPFLLRNKRDSDSLVYWPPTAHRDALAARPGGTIPDQTCLPF